MVIVEMVAVMEFGECQITKESTRWIIENVKTSMYNENRCYIYNKAFARWFDNHDPYNGKTKTGGLFPVGADHRVEKEISLGRDESFIGDTIEGGLDFTSTQKYVSNIKRLLND